MAGTLDLGDNILLREDLIKRTWLRSVKATKSLEKEKRPYKSEKGSRSLEIVFSFPASWSAKDWFFNDSSFGHAEVDLHLFPSLEHFARREKASVNGAFLQRFRDVLSNRKFNDEVDKAVKLGKKVVFTGHSNGGAIATLATLWFLEQYIRPDPNKLRPLCVTFGSPLVGDRIATYAFGRQNWNRHFIHFVMTNDVVPRISLCPLSSIAPQLPQILSFLKSPSREDPSNYLGFYETVVSNASIVTSYAVSKMTGCKDPLRKMVSSFIELSPYRPSGTYVFYLGSGELVVVKNSDAVLQLFFYLLQSSSSDSVAQIVQRSLKCHLNYEDVLTECLKMISISHLDNLDSLPLSSDADNTANSTTSKALNDLGLSTRARLCLRAAGELEKLKQENLNKLEQKKDNTEKGIRMTIEKLEKYKNQSTYRDTSYYDAFKIAGSREDFEANICRLELARMWNEVVVMIQKYQLPDGFECRKDWIELGTRYRRLVEPMDIANFYRHSYNIDSGPYTGNKGRPRRYKCTQRWLEHAERMQDKALESCFWAEVEELLGRSNEPGVEEKVLCLVSRVQKWLTEGVLDNHMYFEGSTFMKLLQAHGL